MAATSKEVSVCEYCYIGFKGKKELKEHLSKGVNTFKCVVKQAREMKNGERKFVCKECGKGFKRSNDLTEHSNVHTKQMTFVCDVEGCAKSYTSRSGMMLHKKTVHEGSFYECPKCNKRFGQKKHVTRHCKIVHEKKKDYKCVACGALFGYKHQLVGHTQSVHDKIRTFKCEQCNSSFSEASNRKRHMNRFHSNNHFPDIGSILRHALIKDDKAQDSVDQQPRVDILKEEYLSKDQLDRPPMVIIKEECLFNDQIEPQPPMDIIKEEFLDQIEPQPPMVIIKEESLLVDDFQSRLKYH